MDDAALDALLGHWTPQSGGNALYEQYETAMLSDLAAMPTLPADTVQSHVAPVSVAPAAFSGAPGPAALAMGTAMDIMQTSSSHSSSTSNDLQTLVHTPPPVHDRSENHSLQNEPVARSSEQPRRQPATVARPQASKTRPGDSRPAPRAAPAGRTNLRRILPKPPAPSQPLSTVTAVTSAAPSPSLEPTKPPLFPDYGGLKAPPARLLGAPPRSTHPPNPLPASTYDCVWSNAAPATASTTSALPVTTSRLPPPAMPIRREKSGQGATRPRKNTRAPAKGALPPPATAQPAPAGATLPPAPLLSEATPDAAQARGPPKGAARGAPKILPRPRAIMREADPMGSSATSTSRSGSPAAGTQDGRAPSPVPLPGASTEASKHRKRVRADDPESAPISKRAAIEERRQPLSLDSTESSVSIGPCVQSHNNILPPQHSHTLQISSPPHATGAEPPSAPTQDGDGAKAKGKGRAIPQRASPAPAAPATSAPASAPVPAPTVALSPPTVPSGDGVRGTTVGRPAPMKRANAAPQPGSSSVPDGITAQRVVPAGPSNDTWTALGSRQCTSTGAAQGSGAAAGPSQPPTADGGAATIDDENGDGKKKKKKKKSKKMKKKTAEEEEAERAKRVAKQATNALSSIQAGLKWCSWMAPSAS